MRKGLLTVAVIAILVISITYLVWHTYDLSSDYNYATAKLDIKNADVKVINIGSHKVSPKEKEIELVSARYGFKNIWIEKFTPQQTEKGIRNYNDLIKDYLILRNGPDWKINYQREVDSLNKIAETQKN